MNTPDCQSSPASGTSALATRATVLICLAYASGMFYGKAFVHWLSGIPHIDNVDATIPLALAHISVSLLPAGLLMLINPITRATSARKATQGQERAIILTSLAISLGLFGICVAGRGMDAFREFYANRLFIDHGALGPIVVIAMSYVIGSAVVLALSDRRMAIVPLAAICLIWGILLSKGAMLAYPLMIYVGLRAARKRRSLLPLIILGGLAIIAVVVLGRLRSGGSLDEVTDADGWRFLLLLALYRIDQLDSFALVLEHARFAYSNLPLQELAESLAYLLPRGILADKPLSYSMEMTQLLRPEVFANDAANNFTLFAQTYMLAGPYGPLLAFSILFGFFVSMALMQRWLFRSDIEFWTFGLAVSVPCFMSLINAGLFHEYVLFHVPLATIGMLALRLHFRRAPELRAPLAGA